MKYVLVLIIFFTGEYDPKLYRYTYLDFIDENTCQVFVKAKRELLEQSVNKQFAHKGIEYQEMTCWSEKEWLEYYESVMDRTGVRGVK